MATTGGDVLACIAAVVRGFNDCADLISALTERRDKKKRRRDKDRELAVQEKLLYRSFIDGAEQVSEASHDRYHNFGPAFNTGDYIAMSELKDVLLSLQGEIMRALQVDSSKADVDLTRLHELSITNKTNAIRAMTELGHRITGGLEQVSSPLRDSSAASPPILFSPIHQRFPSQDSAGRGPHELPPDTHTAHRASIASSQSSQTSQSKPSRFSAGSPRSVFSWGMSRHRRDGSDPRLPPYRQFEQRSGPVETFDVGRQINNLSMNDDPGGTLPYHRASGSFGFQPPRLASDHDPKGNRLSVPESHRAETESVATSMSLSSSEATDEIRRHPEHAPEVVIKGYESMLSHQTERDSNVSPFSPLPNLSNIHPALRPTSMEDSQHLFSDFDQVWSPLARPAQHNNYHNFCKGAWQARQNLREGFSICFLPNSNGEEVPHWKCKHCEFRSKGTKDTEHLPDQVYFCSKTGTRYRWMFLANSHAPCEKPRSQAAKYPYGCIFCAAQGRGTEVYEDLDQLMLHISNKHKTTLMTPEVKSRTNCLVGGTPDKTSLWDVNLPVTSPSKFGDTAKRLFAESVTGLR